MSSELQKAEVRVASSRAALADAKAALRHASEALQAHKDLEMVGEVGMTACCDGLKRWSVGRWAGGVWCSVGCESF